MKLFGHPVSTCTRKVLMTLAGPGAGGLTDVPTSGSGGSGGTDAQAAGAGTSADFNPGGGGGGVGRIVVRNL